MLDLVLVSFNHPCKKCNLRCNEEIIFFDVKLRSINAFKSRSAIESRQLTML